MAAPEKIAGIYIRVSTEEQASGGVSLDMQTNKCMEFCKFSDWRNFEVYREEGISGSSAENRPQLQRLLQDARAHKLNVVLVYKLDRFSRSLRDIILMIDEFKTLGIDFVSFNEKIDTTSSAGKLMFHIIGAFAEFEKNIITERVVASQDDGMEHNTISFMGGQPFGYQLVDGILRVVPEEAAIVKEIFDLYEKGTTMRQIVVIMKREYPNIIPKRNTGLNKFNRKKVNDNKKKAWSSMAISQMLGCHYYLGKNPYKGRILRRAWEPIITNEQFDRVLEIRVKRIQKYQNHSLLTWESQSKKSRPVIYGLMNSAGEIHPAILKLGLNITDDSLCQAWARGMSDNSIAAKYGLHHQSVRDRLDNIGGMPPRGRKFRNKSEGIPQEKIDTKEHSQGTPVFLQESA
jgi:site-specific DNA recombinase